MNISITVPDARKLLSLLRSTDSFPDVVEELECEIELHDERQAEKKTRARKSMG